MLYSYIYILWDGFHALSLLPQKEILPCFTYAEPKEAEPEPNSRRWWLEAWEVGDLEREGLMKGHRVLDRRYLLAELWHFRVTMIKSNVLYVSKSLEKVHSICPLHFKWQTRECWVSKILTSMLGISRDRLKQLQDQSVMKTRLLCIWLAWANTLHLVQERGMQTAGFQSWGHRHDAQPFKALTCQEHKLTGSWDEVCQWWEVIELEHFFFSVLPDCRDNDGGPWWILFLIIMKLVLLKDDYSYSNLQATLYFSCRSCCGQWLALWHSQKTEWWPYSDLERKTGPSGAASPVLTQTRE